MSLIVVDSAGTHSCTVGVYGILVVLVIFSFSTCSLVT